MSEKIECELVELKVPKVVMDFLRKHEYRLPEGCLSGYLERSIVELVEADIKAGDVFVPDPEDVIKENNPGPIFKAVSER